MTSCRDAIARTWPADLQAVAVLTMTSENGQEKPDRVSGRNYDGSVDYGCFQLNNKAHPGFFKNSNWANSVENAAYAYKIFKSRGNFSAWYAVCTPSRQAKKPGIWCK
jgi:hypothetical protein